MHSRLTKRVNQKCKQTNKQLIFQMWWDICCAESYLLHSNLRRCVHVLLRVADTGCVFVLRHAAYWRGRSCSRCSGGPWTHSLSSWESNRIKITWNQMNLMKIISTCLFKTVHIYETYFFPLTKQEVLFWDNWDKSNSDVDSNFQLIPESKWTRIQKV